MIKISDQDDNSLLVEEVVNAKPFVDRKNIKNVFLVTADEKELQRCYRILSREDGDIIGWRKVTFVGHDAQMIAANW